MQLYTSHLVKEKKRNRTYGKYLPIILSLVDWLLFNLFYGITTLIFPEIIDDGKLSVLLWVLVNLCFIPVAVRMARTTTSLRAMQLDRVLLHSLGMVVVHAMSFMSVIALLGINIVPTMAFVTYYGMMMVVIAAWSLCSGRLIKAYRRRGYNYTRVAIIGTNVTARRLYEAMVGDDGFGYKVLGFFDLQSRRDFCGLYCGALDSLEDFVKENQVDQIYYTMSGEDDYLPDVVKIADDNVVEFFYVPQISKYIARGFEMSPIGAVPVLNIRRNPLRKAVNRAIKRVFDILVSSLFLCFYPLIYIPIAITIKLTSPGPIYFKQQRTGYRGKPFECLKFRTMHVNLDSDKQQATKDDPRKTRFGDFLRKSSLDELPQFINVLRGEMSIVGPRPHMLKHTEDYSKLVDRYMVRHLVKPGITGWAQVNGYRGITDELWKMEKRVQCDVWYIEHWTFALDLKIMVRTVINAFQGDSNAF